MHVTRFIPLAAVLAALLATAPVQAADYTFKVYNNVSAEMTGIRVRGGEVSGFSRVRGG